VIYLTKENYLIQEAEMKSELRQIEMKKQIDEDINEVRNEVASNWSKFSKLQSQLRDEFDSVIQISANVFNELNLTDQLSSSIPTNEVIAQDEEVSL
jgi:septal ring factor EnvC (AmiA/AmiB activator)